MQIDTFASALFEGVETRSLIFLSVIYFASFAVKGAIGIGSLTPTVVFGAMVIDAHHAVALALMANILSQLQYVAHGFRDGDWVLARKIIIPNFAAAAIGIWIFGRIGAPELTFVLGLALGLLVLFDIGGVWTMIAAGLISGMTGAGGLFLIAVYLRLVKRDKADFRATILLLAVLVVAWRAAVMIYSGHIDLQIATEGALLFPIILLGGLAGSMAFGRISEKRFTRTLQFVLLFGATVLFWRGLSQLMVISA